jgi:DNA-binding NarL/FixJ family response regulator
MLTSRELQIAHFVAAGKGDKIIAYELGISEYTVREHVRRIYAKLGISKRTTLVVRILESHF